MDSLVSIALPQLAVAFVPSLVVVALLWRWSGEGPTSLYSLARMLGQLLLIGYALNYIFALEHPLPVAGVLCVMLAFASWITLRPVAAQRRTLFGRALLALFVGGGSVFALITQVVLSVEPWFAPRYVIPLAGMIFANSMNSVSIAAERFVSEGERGNPFPVARREALRAGLIPVTNSMFAVGLVSLPGMMTGQILSGVSPLIAARYQIVVMCMLFGASGLSIAMFLTLCKDLVPSRERD